MPSPCWGRPPKRCPSRNPTKNGGWPHLVWWLRDFPRSLKLCSKIIWFIRACHRIQPPSVTATYVRFRSCWRRPAKPVGQGRSKYATEDTWEHSNIIQTRCSTILSSLSSMLVAPFSITTITVMTTTPSPRTPYEYHRGLMFIVMVMIMIMIMYIVIMFIIIIIVLILIRFAACTFPTHWSSNAMDIVGFQLQKALLHSWLRAPAQLQERPRKMDRKCWCWFWPSQAEETWEIIQVKTVPCFLKGWKNVIATIPMIIFWSVHRHDVSHHHNQ